MGRTAGAPPVLPFQESVRIINRRGGVGKQGERKIGVAAKLRFEEAEILLKAGKKIGAVYLAGYTVECFLKALILEGVATDLRKKLLAEFRGQRRMTLSG
jgi:hypothetical protein